LLCDDLDEWDEAGTGGRKAFDRGKQTIEWEGDKKLADETSSETTAVIL